MIALPLLSVVRIVTFPIRDKLKVCAKPVAIAVCLAMRPVTSPGLIAVVFWLVGMPWLFKLDFAAI
ncbi:MAG TPA: hypothetical protein VNS88_06255 [Nitrospiraceae bacterium]|nr:hypothetical protein [Nitrospiraceae bacterium]